MGRMCRRDHRVPMIPLTETMWGTAASLAPTELVLTIGWMYVTWTKGGVTVG